MRDDIDRSEEDFRTPPPYPSTVMIAGIIWITFGSLILLGQGVTLLRLLAAVMSPQAGPDAAAAFGGTACVTLFVVLFAAAFIFVGIQSVAGTAGGTLGNGIGSIVFGMLELVVASLSLFAAINRSAAGATSAFEIAMIMAVLIGFVAFVLVLAGILALVGGADYKAWRRARKAMKTRRREE